MPAAERAEALGIGKDELEQSISFWKRNKIISVELDEGEKLPAYKKKNAESDSEASSSSAKSASVKRHLRDNSLPTYTADELASALDVPDSRKLYEASSTIISISQGPRDRIVSTTKGIEANARGLLITDEYGRTTRPGIFASGDVVAGARTVVEAVEHSKKVAQAMDDYMQGRETAENAD